MKLKYIFSSILFASLIASIISCDDSVNELGTSIQPASDKITVGMDTLALSAKTIQIDSVFGKTNNPILGEYKDPLYGTIRSDYLGELYIPEGSTFPNNATIDSVRVGVFYKSWIGDSISPIELSVYELTKKLPEGVFYTNFEPKNYYSEKSLLGRAMFTVSNSEIAEKERHKKDYYHRVFVKLSNQLGERFLDESKKPNSRLKDSYTLREFFHGLYFTSSFGSGTVIQTDYTLLQFHFHYLDKGGSSQKTDTIRAGTLQLNISPEVTQINHIENKNAGLLDNNSNLTFVKSPAGVYTEVHFPFSSMKDKFASRALNLAKFSLHAVPDISDKDFTLKPPSFLLMLHKDSLNGFFARRKMFDNVTSFFARFNPEKNTYDFGDISPMVNHYKKKHNNEVQDLTYVLVPVDIGFIPDPQRTQKVIPANVANLLIPRATGLRKDKGFLNVEMIFSDF